MVATQSKLFLVAIDGPKPSEWRPFGHDGRTLNELASHYTKVIQNLNCSNNYSLEFTVQKVGDLDKETFSRVVGCLVDVESFTGELDEISDSFREFANRLRSTKETIEITKLYVLSNARSGKDSMDAKKLLALKGHLSRMGFNNNNLILYPLIEDEDIGVALHLMSINLATNEFLQDVLEAK